MERLGWPLPHAYTTHLARLHYRAELTLVVGVRVIAACAGASLAHGPLAQGLERARDPAATHAQRARLLLVQLVPLANSVVQGVVGLDDAHDGAQRASGEAAVEHGDLQLAQVVLRAGKWLV